MKVYQVGGAIRDKILGIIPKDIDYVVVGATPEKMLSLGFVQVGKKFPVFINPKTKTEYALARKEIKIGDKHTDFEFIFTPEITLREDLQRRDFTCNALAYDEENDELFDYNNGLIDIENRILRHVNSEHFVEDPLRILRMCRFSAQLNFEIDESTMCLAQKMVQDKMLENLSAERIWKEIEKALQTKYFEKFVSSSQKSGAFDVIFPELLGKDFSFFERTKECSAKVKFALLISVGASEQEVQEICRRLKVPNEYKIFALNICRNQNEMLRKNSLSLEELVDFVDRLTKGKNQIVLEDLLCLLNILEIEETEAEKMSFMSQIRHIFVLLSEISASDMPDFNLLKNSKEIKGLYKNYRINEVLKKIKK